MSHILAFDTSGPWCAVCLLDKGAPHVRVDEMAKGQAEHLMPLLEGMLADHGMGWADLDCIGVGTGPGNFTGIRIAVSAARGLALGLGVPAIGITRLEAQVYGLPRPVTAVVPAARGQSYLQTFGEPATQPMIIRADDPRIAAASAPLSPDVLIRTIAVMAAERAGTAQPRPAPCYVRPADAAPPKDTAPKILT